MSSSTLMTSFCDAFATRDASALAVLFDKRGLFEFPLVGQRLVGTEEIRSGTRRMFENVARATLSLSATRSAGSVSIGEARLDAEFNDGRPAFSAPCSVVVEADDAAASRISLYIEAHQQRFWVDGPIFAAG